MAAILELKEKRASIWEAAKEINDRAEQENRDLTAEERENWDKALADMASLKGKIERKETEERMNLEMAKSTNDTHRVNPATDDDDKRKSNIIPEFRSYLQTGFVGNEFRALQADSDTTGGFLIAPRQFIGELITEIDNLVFMRNLSTVYQVTSSDSLGTPYLATDAEDATWTQEISSVDEETALAIGDRNWTPHQLTKLVKISQKLLRVSSIPAENLVKQRLAYKFGVTMENAYLTGTGAQQPLGVFTASDNGIGTGRDVSTGNTETTFTADGLKECKYNLKAAYRKNAKWIFHRDGVKMASKFKDGEGQYLWKPGIAEDDPDRLLGYPVYESEYAPSTFTTGLYVGIFGDFSYYWIADMMQLEMQRLNELYARTSQVGFIGRMWSDGMPVMANAFSRVTLA